MSRLLNALVRPALRALTAWLMALGLGLPLLYSANVGHLITQYALLSAATAFGCVFLQLVLNKARKGLFSLLFFGLLIAEGALFLMERGFFYQTRTLISALFLSANDMPVALSLYGDVLCTQLAVLLSLLGFWISTPDAGVAPSLMVVSAFLSGLWILNLQAHSMYLLFTLPALLIIYAATCDYELFEGHHGHLSPLLPVIGAVLLALALTLTPKEDVKYQPLADLAERIKQEINDRFFFQQERARYSLESDGWMPQGQTRLGGKPDPSDENVMQVTADETLYLRGAILDAYTGGAWYDSVSSQRYYFASERNRELREDILQAAYPLSNASKSKQARVKLLANGASTLFVPQRLRTLSVAEDMKAYFNTGSEIFITRNLSAGDQYSFTYLSTKATDPGMAALAAENAGIADPAYAGTAEMYLKLPSHIQQEVHDIAAHITANCTTPWQKAIAIRDYLKNNFAYTLDVQTPPHDVDFVAWFLLAEKEGYCTYFASAMTVLCRMAGLPARYIEGYVAVPVGGTVTVTGRQAHAWTEVYLNGLGWVTFDATPGSGDRDQSGSVPPSALPENQPTPTPDPSPSISPTTTPSSAPGSGEDSADPPSPSPAPTPNSAPDRETPPSKRDDPSAASWLWLLLLIAVILLIAWRIRTSTPLARAARAKTDSAALLIVWSAILESTRVLRFPIAQSETPLHYAERVERENGLHLRAAAQAYSAFTYGRHSVPMSALDAAINAYRSLQERLSPWQKFALAIRRALKFKK